eukprot:364420-Chlamydomonas_euryale.AAC.3
MRRRIQLGLRCCCARKLRDCRRRGVHHAAAVAMHVARQHAAAHGDCVAGHLAPALDCKVEMAVRAEQHLVVAQAVHLGLGVVMDAAWVDLRAGGAGSVRRGGDVGSLAGIRACQATTVVMGAGGGCDVGLRGRQRRCMARRECGRQHSGRSVTVSVHKKCGSSVKW